MHGSRIKYLLLLGALIAGAGLFAERTGFGQSLSVSSSEAGFEEIEEQAAADSYVHPRLRGLETWERPSGPWRVALQAGHWKADEAPEEQKSLRANTGASGGGKAEWEVNLAIARKVEAALEKEGIAAEILPTTVPPNYWADVFVAIHADGNTNSSVSGYKVAAPRRDYSGKAGAFAQLLDEAYGDATGLTRDPNVTRQMRGYYAFNWRRYDHSLHPMTVAAIVETGFLTSPHDRACDHRRIRCGGGGHR